MPENFLEINRYFALTSYCNTIGQSNNAFSILGFSLAGNEESMFSCFHPFIHSLITNNEHHFQQITSTIFQGHTKIALAFRVGMKERVYGVNIALNL